MHAEYVGNPSTHPIAIKDIPTQLWFTQNFRKRALMQDGSSTATCRDYSNGGPAFFASGFEASHDTRLKNLATYTEGNRGVAAVRVQVRLPTQTDP
jgi:hypothetical protein